VENMEASRTIEFFEGAKNLTKEQQDQLLDAKKSFVSSKSAIHTYEVGIREQFSQTADAKAEQKLIEWFIVQFSFYEESIDDKTELFPVFQGENYRDRRAFLISLSDEDIETDDPSFLKCRNIYNESFETLIRVISVWYNRMGRDQKTIDQALKDLFESDEK